MKIEQEKLDEILASHGRWLRGDGGKCANLLGANLEEANLRGVNLYGANDERGREVKFEVGDIDEV